MPPEGRVYVFDAASAGELDLITWIKGEKFIGDQRHVSFGSFESQQDGQIVEVRGTGLIEPVLVSIAIDNMSQKLITVFTLITIAWVTLVAAIIPFIDLLHRRDKSVDAYFERSKSKFPQEFVLGCVEIVGRLLRRFLTFRDEKSSTSMVPGFDSLLCCFSGRGSS